MKYNTGDKMGPSPKINIISKQMDDFDHVRPHPTPLSTHQSIDLAELYNFVVETIGS